MFSEHHDKHAGDSTVMFVTPEPFLRPLLSPVLLRKLTSISQ